MIQAALVINKLTMAIINSVTQEANKFVKPSKKWLTIAKALAYCTTELITAVKSFMIQAALVINKLSMAIINSAT